MPVILDRKFISIFLIISIVAFLRRLLLLVLGIPLVEGEYTSYILLIGAIIPIALGGYAQPTFQKLGCFSLGGSFVLEGVGKLAGVGTSIWFKGGVFLLLGISVISFLMDLKRKKKMGRQTNTNNK